MIDNVVQFGQAQRVTVLPIPEREIDDYIDRGMELLARRLDGLNITSIWTM